MTLLAIRVITAALSFEMVLSAAVDDDWYKTAVDEMKKPAPEAIYTRGDAQTLLGIPYAGHSNGSYAFEKPRAMDLSKEFTDVCRENNG